MRKRVARHVDSCEVCTDKRRTMVSPLALLAAVPLAGAPLYLRDKVMDRVELVAYESRAPKKPRPTRMPMAAAAATLLVAIGVAAVWDRDANIPGFPVALDLPPSSSLGSSAPPSTGATTTESSSSAAPTTTTTTTRTTPRTTTTTTTTTTNPPPPDTVAPTIVRQSASSKTIGVSGCPIDRMTLSATATDNVAVTSVTVKWTDAVTGAPGSASMAPQRDGSWSTTIGPFPKVTRITWQVTAADAAGNTNSGPSETFSVENCIG
jgi:hypothetical protein